MHAKDLDEPKYQFLIEKHEVGIKHLNYPRAFIEYSNTMDDVYNNIDDYNPISFDDMIGNIMTNKRFQTIIKELPIRCKKLNVSCIYHTVLFFCSKRSQIKIYALPNNEN